MLRCIWQQGASRCFPFKVEEAGDGADMALSVMLMLGGAELQDDEERLQQDQHEQADLSSGGSSASSVVGEGDAPGLEEQPVPPPGVVVDLAELLARQGLREQFEGERSKHPAIYDNVVNKCIGRMQTICGNPKAVCSLHGPGSACSFFLSVSATSACPQNRAYAVLYRWLADGRNMTQAEHQARAKEMKTQLGMKPKK